MAEIPLAVADLPSYESLGGDATGTRIGEFLFADYAEAGQSPNPGMGVWFFRTAYDAVAGLPIDVSIAKHRREWRQVLGLQPVTSPIAPIAPREYSGNLCGVRVPGLPRVPGGAADASLVLSWFYDRYSTSDRAAIRSAWATKGQFDVILSWPDSRVVVGQSPSGFVAICRELIRDGFRPCVMLLSKDFDPHHDVAGCLRNVEAILPLLLEPRVASRICIGWELSLWLSSAEVQQLTNAIAPRSVAASVKTYVHFQQGFAHYADGPNATFASYWNQQVGKLTGLFHQRDLQWSEAEYQARLNDILVRFAGGFGTVPDSGFGHPFDCVAFEITAQPQFNGTMSEAEGNRWGQVALATPTANGPAGTVRVMGSGNGS